MYMWKLGWYDCAVNAAGIHCHQTKAKNIPYRYITSKQSVCAEIFRSVSLVLELLQM